MYTKEQLELAVEIQQMITDQGAEFAAGYLASMATAMLSTVKSKRAQKIWVHQVRDFNAEYPVEVKNIMTGEPVKILRRDVGTALDPSMERYWSM